MLALVRHEDERGPRCCNTGSARWNEICRDPAAEGLAHARLARGADEIVLADPGHSGWAVSSAAACGAAARYP